MPRYNKAWEKPGKEAFDLSKQIGYPGMDMLPKGRASERLTEGCLVLEGGAFRGVYTNGVLDALMEHDINFDHVVGVSAGAMTAANYVSGQIGRSARINLGYRLDGRYVGLRPLLRDQGIIGFDFVFHTLDKVFPFDRERFDRPEQRLIAVATDCRTGKPAYLEKGRCDIYQAIRASASMPYLSKMVYLDGVPYLDGGCSVKIPYAWALEQGFEKIVVVRTRPTNFRHWTDPDRRARRFYRKWPAFAGALAGANERYDRECSEIAKLEKQGRLFVIAPSQSMKIGRLERDLEKLGAWYYVGYRDGQDAVGPLLAYLNAGSPGK